MIYAFEYLNSLAEVVILEYDVDSGKLCSFISHGTSKDYVEPNRYQIYVCEKREEEDALLGKTRAWYQQIGTLTMCDEGGNEADAIEVLTEMLDENDMATGLNTLIEVAKKGLQ
jgi:hypothetical protein